MKVEPTQKAPRLALPHDSGSQRALPRRDPPGGANAAATGLCLVVRIHLGVLSRRLGLSLSSLLESDSPMPRGRRRRLHPRAGLDHGVRYRDLLSHSRPVKIYKLHERPAVEVLVDDTWFPGELRGTWRRRGRRLCNVSWRDRIGMTHLDSVPADHVRTHGNAKSRVNRP